MRSFHATLVILEALLSSGCGLVASTHSETDRASNDRGTPAPGDTADYDAPKGTWHVTAILASSRPVAADRVKQIGLQYIFDGDKMTIHRPDRADQTSTYTVDGNASPKKMTINQSPVIRAVYVLEGNKLQICLMFDDSPNAGYPTDLASKASPKTDLLSLERRSP
jgi:uncharacterized protein (TIGR03067 family)